MMGTTGRVKLIVYDGGNDWAEGTLAAIGQTRCSYETPAVNEECEYRRFVERWAVV